MRPLTISQNRHGEPRITVVVEGEQQIFRWAYYYAHGPVEHMGEATRIFRYLRRRMGIKRFTELDQRMTGGKVVEWGLHRRVSHD